MLYVDEWNTQDEHYYSYASTAIQLYKWHAHHTPQNIALIVTLNLQLSSTGILLQSIAPDKLPLYSQTVYKHMAHMMNALIECIAISQF